MRFLKVVSVVLGRGVFGCGTIAANAADLPKEGVSNSFGFTTFKPMPIGNERLLTSRDGNGLSFTNGFGNHMSWHCRATGDYTL